MADGTILLLVRLEFRWKKGTVTTKGMRSKLSLGDSQTCL
jgi:hypothetical protein